MRAFASRPDLSRARLVRSSGASGTKCAASARRALRWLEPSNENRSSTHKAPSRFCRRRHPCRADDRVGGVRRVRSRSKRPRPARCAAAGLIAASAMKRPVLLFGAPSPQLLVIRAPWRRGALSRRPTEREILRARRRCSVATAGGIPRGAIVSRRPRQPATTRTEALGDDADASWSPARSTTCRMSLTPRRIRRRGLVHDGGRAATGRSTSLPPRAEVGCGSAARSRSPAPARDRSRDRRRAPARRAGTLKPGRLERRTPVRGRSARPYARRGRPRCRPGEARARAKVRAAAADGASWVVARAGRVRLAAVDDQGCASR